MADKTYDVENPRELPYRFTYSPITQEVLVICFGRVVMFFENRESFHRFLIEGNKTDSLIADPMPENIKDITTGGG